MGTNENSYGHALLQKSVTPSYENSVPRTYTPQKKLDLHPWLCYRPYGFSLTSRTKKGGWPTNEKVRRIFFGHETQKSFIKLRGIHEHHHRTSFHFILFIHFKFSIHGGPMNQGWLLLRGPWKSLITMLLKKKKNFYNAK